MELAKLQEHSARAAPHNMLAIDTDEGPDLPGDDTITSKDATTAYKARRWRGRTPRRPRERVL